MIVVQCITHACTVECLQVAHLYALAIALVDKPRYTHDKLRKMLHTYIDHEGQHHLIT